MEQAMHTVSKQIRNDTIIKCEKCWKSRKMADEIELKNENYSSTKELKGRRLQTEVSRNVKPANGKEVTGALWIWPSRL
jgi:hypothetical protein